MSSPLNLPLATAILFSLMLLPPALSGVSVTHLPGFTGPLPFQLETGYESMGNEEFFYYFVQSERNPREDPLIVWLTGGPDGCSALCGFLLEIGPLRFIIAEYNGSLPSLIYNPYSWSKVANIIFLDAPIGSGFSYSTCASDYELNDTVSSLQTCNFLIKWYESHPDFLSNPLYIAGDSYAGKLVPLVTHAIVTGELSPLFSNLKGYIIGNPITDKLFDSKSRVPFSHGMAIISDELYKEIKENCAEEEDYDHPNPQNLLCYGALSEFKKFCSEIYDKYILEPKCPPPFMQKSIVTTKRSLGEELYKDILLPSQAPDMKCRTQYAQYLLDYWTNNSATREALHIKKGSIQEWVTCNRSLHYTMNIPSTLVYHHDLIQRGYRALVYSGDHDLVAPFRGTHAWIRSLNFSIVDDWRSWHVHDQVAGYTRKFKDDLTFATVKNAGHTAATYQPENCLAMFERWISHESL
ncbi:serine carboxypeptidase-like 13 [Asparagus officinalis]|uniref:serine carboxypeptidase-like 13 n=1 Tax=Asparagus officinalis TaxID=4686 RepID=UPI00098E3094|nr:serine carboxypeptidase-like 13 [Asparagus officinalis]